MSDAPLQGAPINGASGLPPKVDPRDVADIDRELEAYLKEKKLSEPINLDHSVDAQLSRIKERTANRLDKKTPHVPSKPVETKPVEKEVPTKTPPVEAKKPEPQKPPAPEASSHSDLIKALEQKYSVGKKDEPQNKKEALEQVPVPSKPVESESKPVGATAASPVQKTDTPKTETSPKPEKETEDTNELLRDLKESIASGREKGTLELLNMAEKLDSEEQENLVNTFLPRYRRNKERQELFLRTQSDLEKELEAFINGRLVKTRPQSAEVESGSSSREDSPSQAPAQPSNERPSPAVSVPGIEKITRAETAPHPASQKSVNDSPEQTKGAEADTRKDVPRTTATLDPDLARSDSKEAHAPAKETPPPSPTPSPEQKPQSGESEVIERYKRYLASLDKKPTVLLYDPSEGFVRKAVDPNDSSLNLSYSYDEGAKVVTLQVFDTNGAILSEIKTPAGEF